MKKQFALAPHHREKETKMQSKVMTTIFALVLALTLSVGAASVFAKDLHVTKECSQFAGAAGDLLHDHILEPRCDQEGLEGFL